MFQMRVIGYPMIRPHIRGLPYDSRNLPPSEVMTKWEYLSVAELKGVLKGHEGGKYTTVGLKLNDEELRYKTVMQHEREYIDAGCEIKKKWESNGHYQFLNYLGEDGWELIKSSGPYIFKRPLK